jgi:hypothetical protein
MEGEKESLGGRRWEWARKKRRGGSGDAAAGRERRLT